MAEVPSTLDHTQWKGYQSIKELIQQTREYLLLILVSIQEVDYPDFQRVYIPSGKSDLQK